MIPPMRIAVLGAGGPAGVNVCKALHAAGHTVIGLDGNQHHLAWAQPWCAYTLSAPPFGTAALDNLSDDLDVDLWHTQPEQGLSWLTQRDRLPSFLPPLDVIEDCQHKNTAGMIWEAAGLKSHQPHRVFEPYPDMLHLAKDDLGLPFWLRAGQGAGARGATLVTDLRVAYHWMRYWDVREEPMEWIAEEYLPGRDYCWTSVWRHGVCFLSFARERLEWIYPHLAPSGRTGTPTIAVTVHDDRVTEMAKQAVVAIDKNPTGLFCVDLREDYDGVPRPTEINVGRFATTSPIYHEIGDYNPADLYARLGAGHDLQPVGDDIYPEDIALCRHIDCGHVWQKYNRETGAMAPLQFVA